jgi:transcriptional regulator with XRE-family HTH domain
MRYEHNFLFMDEKLEFAGRLAAAMSAAGYEARPSVLEAQFNTRYWGKPVTYQAVTRWLRGEAIPAQDKLQILADWLNIEPHVLRFGETTIKSVRDKRKRWDEGIGYQEREVFEAFLALPAPQRKMMREMILLVAKACEAEPKS